MVLGALSCRAQQQEQEPGEEEEDEEEDSLREDMLVRDEGGKPLWEDSVCRGQCVCVCLCVCGGR